MDCLWIYNSQTKIVASPYLSKSRVNTGKQISNVGESSDRLSVPVPITKFANRRAGSYAPGNLLIHFLHPDGLLSNFKGCLVIISFSITAHWKNYGYWWWCFRGISANCLLRETWLSSSGAVVCCQSQENAKISELGGRLPKCKRRAAKCKTEPSNICVSQCWANPFDIFSLPTKHHIIIWATFLLTWTIAARYYLSWSSIT